MSSISSAVVYKPCFKCNRRLVRASDTFCKDCKPKKESIRTLSKDLSKVYLHKFETNATSHIKKYNKETYVPNILSTDSSYKLKKEISLQKNIKNTALFFTLYWNQFSDFDSFSSFISRTGQVSFVYFLYNSFIIQQKPRYQQFIIEKQDEIPAMVTTIQLIPPIPISRPLQLLTQKSYWDSLITSYFKYVHPTLLLFSIHSFNPQTAAKSLLSAIYYGGFHFMQDKPPELIRYFNEYAKSNIKEATKLISLQNAQATFLYSFFMILSGNFKVFKACQAHTIRMSYALGLHLNLKKLTPIQQYDRFQFFSNISTLHILFYGTGNLTLNQLTELGDCNTKLFRPEYQIPNSKCAFYFDTEDENILYGICTDIYFKLYNMQAQQLFNLSRCSENSIQTEFFTLFNNSKQKYFETILTFEFLLQEFSHLKSNIQSCKFKLISYYHTINLEIFPEC
ncbi:hypothetical protein CONCODRAFT_11519 [Conidiobolus coronatus NRRL 28638]|uniref:Xylanolytic transcriptional activator regulatory domain-containing protein n=1 Tax=Conidiobolus coronatus (strain ATCC 28846 / CBS 209.66 / NRRL 28638) TaxID=796925 RepID=A0A137NUV3_CONC2|nr:hypothetical protein CONCODRAFT_11519 [Conidiobolus coronatus NRRL 28638]|eukprot:KXN66595.1 hypothetical protein CONCODRAFT_11519 [Conidiobolus coronatus NRRL 28638]